MTEHTSEHREPYFDDDEAKAIIGKRVLAGVSRRNRDDEVTGLEPFHGEVVRATREEGILLRWNDAGEVRWIPPDLSRLAPASPGHYKRKGTGEVLVEPDFLATSTVDPSDQRT